MRSYNVYLKSREDLPEEELPGRVHGWYVKAENIFEAMKKIMNDKIYGRHPTDWAEISIEETK